jgi:hypothetical protein
MKKIYIIKVTDPEEGTFYASSYDDKEKAELYMVKTNLEVNSDNIQKAELASVQLEYFYKNIYYNPKTLEISARMSDAFNTRIFFDEGKLRAERKSELLDNIKTLKAIQDAKPVIPVSEDVPSFDDIIGRL